MRNEGINHIVFSQLSIATSSETTHYLGKVNTGNALQYINSFLTSYWELNDIPGKVLSDSHALSMLLRGITNPDYSTFVQIQKNKSE
eukprot:6844704-Ditylum_brightwellii.AAC.1